MIHNRAAAWELLNKYMKNKSLINHSLSVEAAMRWHAVKQGLTDAEIEMWSITGLLHDFDYEMYPEPVAPNGHPFKGNAILTELGYPAEIKEAIMGHALYTGTPRISLMAKTLFAVDELCGLVTASVLVRPDKSIHTLEAKSVLKKMKDKHFAAGCNRDDIKQGAQEIGTELSQLITNVIEAMREISQTLGLSGVTAQSPQVTA
jgi:predicted hydrolase (HD superfamily)